KGNLLPRLPEIVQMNVPRRFKDQRGQKDEEQCLTEVKRRAYVPDAARNDTGSDEQDRGWDTRALGEHRQQKRHREQRDKSFDTKDDPG
ncbi:MAG: hypothetical protein ABIZ82_07310, partial [Candidatus Tumulicola sp.]